MTTGSAGAARYHDLPMPERWKPLLEPFRPALTGTFPELDLEESGALIDLCLSPRAPRTSTAARNLEILWQHVACQRTLGSVGAEHGVTRQRAQQIHARALHAARNRGAAALGALRDTLNTNGTIVHVTGRSVRWPDASGEEQWCMLAALLRGGTFESRALPGGRALCGQAGPLDLKEAERLLHAHPRFWPLPELITASSCDAAAIHASQHLGGPLLVTRSGFVLSASWTQAQLFTAVALELHGAGVPSWHFSEMASAANFVDEARNVTHRTAAGVVASASGNLFTPAGTQGLWRLTRCYEDQGNTDANRLTQAVTAILNASDLPLHVRIIHARLTSTRECWQDTLRQTLSTDPAFIPYGRGVYGLASQPLPPLPEEPWAAALLASQPSGTLGKNAMHAAAVQANIDPQRLNTIARFSETVQLRGKTRPAYCSRDAAVEHDVNAWYHTRRARTGPLDPDLLQAYLKLPASDIRPDLLPGILRVYRFFGWDVPEERRA